MNSEELNTNIPATGMLVLVEPLEEGFNASLRFVPKDTNDLEANIFYLALGYGLTNIAVNQTTDIVNLGMKVIQEIQSRQDAQEDILEADYIELPSDVEAPDLATDNVVPFDKTKVN